MSKKEEILSGYERLKRWRAKHPEMRKLYKQKYDADRVQYNLQYNRVWKERMALFNEIEGFDKRIAWLEEQESILYNMKNEGIRKTSNQTTPSSEKTSPVNR